MTKLALALLLVLAGAVEAGAQPDVLVSAATGAPGNVVIVPANGYGAFALAAVNTGPTRDIIVCPSGAAICRTDPTTGECVFPLHPVAQVSFSMQAHQVYTFSVFPHSDTFHCGGPATMTVSFLWWLANLLPPNCDLPIPRPVLGSVSVPIAVLQ